jgi:signal transduction histidine kinase
MGRQAEFILGQLRTLVSAPSKREAKALVCLLAAVIAAVDLSLPANINVATLYFICIVLLVWTNSVKWLWTSTAIFILLTFGGLTLAPAPILHLVTWVDWLNRSVTALALVVAAVPVHLRLRSILALQAATAERDRAEQALQHSYAQLEATVQERTRELYAEIAESARTALKLRESEQSLRNLSVRLMKSQDEERRRIARALHDTVGQYLALSKMTLESWLKNPDASDRGIQALCQIADSLDKCSSETRNISYLLHPPLLDELGFASAARTYVEGFSQRSKIPVALSMPGEMKRLPSGLELVLFRMLQESLTNVLRYAHSPTVDIQIEIENHQIALTVQDYGKGMPPELVHQLNAGCGGGVGLSGMRERILQFHGNFKIESDRNGTSIRAVLPMTTAEFVKTAAT